MHEASLELDSADSHSARAASLPWAWFAEAPLWVPWGSWGGWLFADSWLPLSFMARAFWLGGGLRVPRGGWPLVGSGVPRGCEFAGSNLRPSWSLFALPWAAGKPGLMEASRGSEVAALGALHSPIAVGTDQPDQPAACLTSANQASCPATCLTPASPTWGTLVLQSN